MTAILARLPRSSKKSPHEAYAWYSRALAEGYGIAAPIPHDDPSALDRLMGMFLLFLRKRMERDTFFAVLADERSSQEDTKHTKEMCSLLPKDTMCIGKERTGEIYVWLEIEQKEKIENLAQKVIDAKERGKKTFVSYNSDASQSEESFAEAIEKILALAPDFIATDRPRQARVVVDAHKTESKFKVFLRSKSVRYVRGRIGHIRFLLRELPLYTIIFLLERMTGKLISLHTRPLYADDYTAEGDTLKKMPRTAIVMQGPVMRKSNFTIETIRLYKKMFPPVQIILSTWEDEDPALLDEAREAGAEIVTSKKPAFGGPGNTNMQLASSYAGIKHAKKTGAEYALKQRTDVRMYNARAMEFMLNLLVQFPPSARSKQKARIIATGSALYQPYQYGEFIFGAIEDMDAYYSCPLIEKDEKFEHYVVEMYIPTQFLKRNGWDLKWTIEDGWQAMRECFIVLDWAILDKVTYKYFQFRYWEYQNQRHYTKGIPLPDASRFDAWLNVYTAYENKTLRPDQRLFFELLPRSEDVD